MLLKWLHSPALLTVSSANFTAFVSVSCCLLMSLLEVFCVTLNSEVF